MSDELKPCPFCGGEASDAGHIRYSPPLRDAWWDDEETPITEAFYVNCMKCGAVSRSGIIGGYRTKAEAVERWNRRAPLPSPVSDGGAVLTRFAQHLGEYLRGLEDEVERSRLQPGLSRAITLTGSFANPSEPSPVSDGSEVPVRNDDEARAQGFVSFTNEYGHTVRCQIVDKDGKPVPQPRLP